MTPLLTLGQTVSAAARVFPARLGARDRSRSLTFADLNARACRLANALLGLGLAKGDRVAVLAYNRVEWMEIYAATAKAGLTMVPVNFRLTPPEIAFIVGDCGAAAVIAEAALADRIEEVRDRIPVPNGRHILMADGARAGWTGYEELLGRAADTEPGVPVGPDDTWALMYTSGTTGNPKGAIRTHRGAALLSLVTEVELGFSRRDTGLLVMPMCHANSLYFATSLAYCGGGCHVYDSPSFDAELALGLLADGPTFASMVPTQYAMMLELPGTLRARHPTDNVRKLMISSAPARRELKAQVMEAFPNSGLFELYGSTEAGWVTMLQPEEQFTKLGSVGRECVGSLPVRLLDDEGNEVAEGETGELFSHTPYTFEGYWNLPQKTAEAFRDGYCSVGDMARRDADGFLHLVDRKSNMIISGGENVYPTEVEAVLGGHPAVRECAVIGLPDAKWGERVHAVVVLRNGAALAAAEVTAWCRDRLAGYKLPRSATFLAAEDIPKTATGKVQHRKLRQKIIDEGTGT